MGLNGMWIGFRYQELVGLDFRRVDRSGYVMDTVLEPVTEGASGTMYLVQDVENDELVMVSPRDIFKVDMSGNRLEGYE